MKIGLKPSTQMAPESNATNANFTCNFTCRNNTLKPCCDSENGLSIALFFE